ncbi:MAG: DUF2934 domain-containing protein [Nitrosomonas sp.]|nr:DUF2934 domain-containing protein [Nitrosomonas sp.]
MKVSGTQAKSNGGKPVTTRGKAKMAQLDNSESDLQFRIQVAAYYKAQARGFAPGYELDDWLAAEKESKQ